MQNIFENALLQPTPSKVVKQRNKKTRTPKFPTGALYEILENLKIDIPSKITHLMTAPKRPKGKNRPSIRVPRENAVHQADLLKLPDDDGKSDLLVVVDLHSKFAEVRPLSSKRMGVVLKALKDIYSNSPYLSIPSMLQTDNGTEFNAIPKFMKDHGGFLRRNKAGRHKQQAQVENMNKILGTAIYTIQNVNELITGARIVEWVDLLPEIMRSYNEYILTKDATIKPIPPASCQGDDCDLLQVGDRVRIPLDEPILVDTKKKIYGSFRATDLRFDPTPRTIRKVLITPGQPPLYVVAPIKKKGKTIDPLVAYTKGELQIISPDEKGNKRAQTFYVLKQIHDERGTRDNKEYLVEWKDYPLVKDYTWEPLSKIKRLNQSLLDDWKAI